ncbi:MAG: hypothetical protein IT518_07225 [Burkholderiales bacterium]|nr:hypothetical protein [Burkholderiales bacterium]
MRRHCFAVALMLAGSAGAQSYAVEGSCRDGRPHGNYELRDPGGGLRVAGAFNRGKRTGSFLFWSSAGARIAHLPFEDDVLSGTLALWWPPPAKGAQPPPKLEATYVHGKLSGTKRSWFANGKPRAEFRYEQGTLAAARGVSEAGAALSDADARALAARDLESDEALLASLSALVTQHPPRCDPASDRLEKS